MADETVEFWMALGEEAATRWALSATAEVSFGHKTLKLTASQVMRVLHTDGVRAALEKQDGFAYSAKDVDARNRETIRQLTARVAELQGDNDNLRSTINSLHNTKSSEIWELFNEGRVFSWAEIVTEIRRLVAHDKNIQRELKCVVEQAFKGERAAAVFPGHRDLASQVLKLREAASPVPMLLFCPMCHSKHIDEGEFATKPHHTHACQGWIKVPSETTSLVYTRRRCGHVWRPAIVPTVGVEALPGFINEPGV